MLQTVMLIEKCRRVFKEADGNSFIITLVQLLLCGKVQGFLNELGSSHSLYSLYQLCATCQVYTWPNIAGGNIITDTWNHTLYRSVQHNTRNWTGCHVHTYNVCDKKRTSWSVRDRSHCPDSNRILTVGKSPRLAAICSGVTPDYQEETKLKATGRSWTYFSIKFEIVYYTHVHIILVHISDYNHMHTYVASSV